MLRPELQGRMKPYIQPFERDLALREMNHLSKASLRFDNGTEFRVIDPKVDADFLASRVAYWEYVGASEPVWTKQLRREATTLLARNRASPGELTEILPFSRFSVPVPNRRCLRYGPHDIHDYRGKFFPQLVRALLNISDLPPEAVVLDPMCGSGTTLLESNLAGYDSVGLDINPLSVLIAKTKCEILGTPPDTIIAEYDRLERCLAEPAANRQDPAMHYFSALPSGDQRYLEAWFHPQVLEDLDRIATTIQDNEQSPCRELFQLCMSDILRRVSRQKTDDLRSRRDLEDGAGVDTVAQFLDQSRKTVLNVVAFLLEEAGFHSRTSSVVLGDARDLTYTMVRESFRADVVITSPPYATALPYLDTDRLSLCYLQLLPRSMHRSTDLEMIGNREVTKTQRRRLWEQYAREMTVLPPAVRDVIDKVDEAYRNSKVGFRRRNLSALLAKYFLDMRQVLASIRDVTNAGAHVYVVIGDNHTMAHGKRIDIETGSLLGEIGVSVGMELVESIPMQMLEPRDIFKKNSVSSERILHYRVGT